MRDLTQRQGKELSFNNLLDIDAAMWAVACWSTRPACGIIKHTTPCGIAVAGTAVEAFRSARATDPVSAFGSVIAFNTVVDRGHRAGDERSLRRGRRGAVVPRRGAGRLRRRKALRVVELPVSRGPGSLDFKRVRGGFLVQDQFQFDPSDQGWSVATDRQPTEREWNDLRFAWAAVASVKSNAILLARDEAAIGIGAGQMSRVDSAFLAVHKARQAGHDPAGSVLASDGFFPFADGVEQAAGGRRDRHHPAGRLRARRGSRRGRQSPWPRDGDDRPPPVQTLAQDSMTAPAQERPPYLLGLRHLPRRLPDLLRHPGADDRVLGHLGVHRGSARCSASRIRPATRCSSSWRTPSACSRSPPPMPSGSTCSRPSPAPRPPGSGSSWRSAGSRGIVQRAVGPLRRGVRRRAGGRHLLVGVEPEHGQREGVHRLAVLDRAGDVAGGPLGRRRARAAPRPLAGAHRLRAGAHLDQPPDGPAGGPGPRGLRAVDRLARDHPPDRAGRASCSRPWWASRSTTSGCRCARPSIRRSTRASPSGSSARR